ncbi:MAG: group III truncated hemoglobin [Bdellovibrionales bacterium]
MNQAPALTESVTLEETSFTLLDINKVINDFYSSVSKDPLLSVPFSSVTDWPHHIDNLTHFWWIKFGGARYSDARYNPPMKHFKAGFSQEFLTRWLELFKVSLDKNLTPKQADTWFGMSQRMGQFLLQKNEAMKASFKNG